MSLQKIFVSIAVWLFASEAAGQVSTATFYGRVTNPMDAGVQGAVVSLRHDETAATLLKSTDSAGEFQFDLLHAGSHTLTIHGLAFKKYEATHWKCGCAAGAVEQATYVLNRFMSGVLIGETL